MNLSRPFGTYDIFAPDPALKRRAIVVCPFGTWHREERTSESIGFSLSSSSP